MFSAMADGCWFGFKVMGVVEMWAIHPVAWAKAPHSAWLSFGVGCGIYTEIWTRLEPSSWCDVISAAFKRIICLLDFQMTALCSRQQMMNNGNCESCLALLRGHAEPSMSRMCALGQPAVAQYPALSLSSVGNFGFKCKWPYSPVQLQYFLVVHSSSTSTSLAWKHSLVCDCRCRFFYSRRTQLIRSFLS